MVGPGKCTCQGQVMLHASMHPRDARMFWPTVTNQNFNSYRQLSSAMTLLYVPVLYVAIKLSSSIKMLPIIRRYQSLYLLTCTTNFKVIMKYYKRFFPDLRQPIFHRAYDLHPKSGSDAVHVSLHRSLNCTVLKPGTFISRVVLSKGPTLSRYHE